MAKSSRATGDESTPVTPASTASRPTKGAIEKLPSGISGFDDITVGGLPKGRPTLVYGGPGCGKTLFGMQFLARGAVEYGDAGVFLAFEETIDDLKQNVRSLGFDLGDLIARKLLTIEHAIVNPAREIGRGEYDLDALFMRLARAIDTVKASRVVLDSLEVVIHREPDRAAVRDSLRRLFRWLGNRGVTSIVTGEQAENGRSRHGFEDYIADCVVHLDHRVQDQLSTRRLRVVKYRGSPHGTNEYPFLIDETGLHVMPVTSIGLAHHVTNERVSSGVAALDAMLDGKGFFRGTTVMISGTPGSGKSSLSAHYADAACGRGERVLVVTYEESPDQVMRNMRSIGLDLGRWVDLERLRFIAARPSMYGLEKHLVVVLKAVDDFNPQSVVIDPISNLVRAGGEAEAHGMVVRLIDALKTGGLTTILTHPTGDLPSAGSRELAISSIIDTWILMQAVERRGERRRTLCILKSRGMAHSHQVREFRITAQGLRLVTVYRGPSGPLRGSARPAQAKGGRRGGPSIARARR